VIFTFQDERSQDQCGDDAAASGDRVGNPVDQLDVKAADTPEESRDTCYKDSFVMFHWFHDHLIFRLQPEYGCRRRRS